MNKTPQGSKSLDVMVGLEIMGFCVVQPQNPCTGPYPILIKVEEFDKEKHVLLPNDPGTKAGQLVMLHPAIEPWSRSNAHALRVLEELHRQGWSYMLTNAQEKGTKEHHCLFWKALDPKPDGFTASKHFSEAVCIAAIRAKGVEFSRILRALREGTP